MLRPVNVARAAPVTPSRGNGPRPKIRQGSRTRLMMFDVQSERMAIAASPAPRKMALLRNNIRMAPEPPRCNTGIAGSCRQDVGRCSHQLQQARCEDEAGNPNCE